MYIQQTYSHLFDILFDLLLNYSNTEKLKYKVLTSVTYTEFLFHDQSLTLCIWPVSVCTVLGLG